MKNLLVVSIFLTVTLLAFPFNVDALNVENLKEPLFGVVQEVEALGNVFSVTYQVNLPVGVRFENVDFPEVVVNEVAPVSSVSGFEPVTQSNLVPGLVNVNVNIVPSKSNVSADGALPIVNGQLTKAPLWPLFLAKVKESTVPLDVSSLVA